MTKVTLNSITNSVKNNKILIVLGIISIILFSLFIATFITNKTTPKQNPDAEAWQNKIYPGVTSVTGLEQALGPPLKKTAKDNKIQYFYGTANEYRPHEVEIESEKVTLVKEQVLSSEDKSLREYIDTLGPEEAKLYGAVSSYTPGFFWGNKGIIVFAGQFDQTIIEIWYFKPSTLDEFLKIHPEIKTERPETTDGI